MFHSFDVSEEESCVGKHSCSDYATQYVICDKMPIRHLPDSCNEGGKRADNGYKASIDNSFTSVLLKELLCSFQMLYFEKTNLS